MKPSAECCFPVSERFRRCTPRLPKTFTGLLLPVPLVKVTLNLLGVLVPLPLPFQDVLAGLETSFFSGSESYVRDCGLWFGGTGEN